MSESEENKPLFVCGSGGGAPGTEQGEPCTDEGRCPKCGSETGSGYGLAYGGMGVYHYCLNDDCDWFWKLQDADESA